MDNHGRGQFAAELRRACPSASWPGGRTLIAATWATSSTVSGGPSRSVAHTEQALSAVETEYERRQPADDPAWVYWLDEDEITVMAGLCYVELGQPDRAIPLLTGVLVRYDERQARESALYTSWLAEAHVQAREVEHAAALAERTLELSRSTRSSRGDDRVTLLAQRLAPHRVVGVVREFLDHEAARRSVG